MLVWSNQTVMSVTLTFTTLLIFLRIFLKMRIRLVEVLEYPKLSGANKKNQKLFQILYSIVKNYYFCILVSGSTPDYVFSSIMHGFLNIKIFKSEKRSQESNLRPKCKTDSF